MTNRVMKLFKDPDAVIEAQGNMQAFEYPGLNLGAQHQSADQKAQSLVFGFWIFMMSDAILFGMAFATYGTMIPHGFAGGPTPKDIFHLGPAFIETMLLLASSFTFGMATVAMKYRRATSTIVAWLIVTGLLGVAFLTLEWQDFSAMFAMGATPQRSGFLSSFYGLVPLHGLHVIAGCIWLVCMLIQIVMHGMDDKTKLGIMRLAIFWHFLDIVWIFIFSVVYLGGLA